MVEKIVAPAFEEFVDTIRGRFTIREVGDGIEVVTIVCDNDIDITEEFKFLRSMLTLTTDIRFRNDDGKNILELYFNRRDFFFE